MEPSLPHSVPPFFNLHFSICNLQCGLTTGLPGDPPAVSCFPACGSCLAIACPAATLQVGTAVSFLSKSFPGAGIIEPGPVEVSFRRPVAGHAASGLQRETETWRRLRWLWRILPSNPALRAGDLCRATECYDRCSRSPCNRNCGRRPSQSSRLRRALRWRRNTRFHNRCCSSRWLARRCLSSGRCLRPCHSPLQCRIRPLRNMQRRNLWPRLDRTPRLSR